MSASTNQLVARSKRFAAPAGIAATLVLAGTFFLNHSAVHASSTTAPLDDNSVSSLVALDTAVENVAARVTPAVVNVSVTSKSTEQAGDDGGEMEGLPPGLRQFFRTARPRPAARSSAAN